LIVDISLCYSIFVGDITMDETINPQINKVQENEALNIPPTNNKKGGNFYKAGFFIFGSILLLTIGVLGGWYFFSPQKQPLPPKPSPTITSIQTTEKPISPTIYISPEGTAHDEMSPTQNVESDLEKIKIKMAERHDKTIETTNITIGKNTGTHASGGVKFEGEIGGGWFLAAKRDGEWVIVDDGNGTISCEVIEPWDFPVDLVEECVDEEGSLVRR
jgi:hypothetical protein